MLNQLKTAYSRLMAHHLAILLFLALIALTLGGAGNAALAGFMGIILCLAGAAQENTAVDLWVLVPLLIFDVFSMASSYAAYGTIAAGFAPTQIIFTLLYLLMACLDDGELFLLRRLCVLWAEAAAAFGILQFLYQALTSGAVRLSGVLGNPNAMGIFLTLGWFALLASEQKQPSRLLARLEPILLAALALTLSMGSFLSMAAGILLAFVRTKRRAPWRDSVSLICGLLARASAGIGTGLLIYIAARRTDIPWLSVLPALYLLAAAWNWNLFLRFLKDRPRAAASITGLGVLVAAAAVLVRPSAIATFSERLEMMANGLRYLFQNPLLGVGPYQWRILNYSDSDLYFNTWHIHNVFLHVGVELGLVAMAALLAVTIRHFVKKDSEKSGSTAFLVHSLIDTGFFYEAIPALLLLTVSRPRAGGRRLNRLLARAVFLALLAVSAYNLYRIVWS